MRGQVLFMKYTKHWQRRILAVSDCSCCCMNLVIQMSDPFLISIHLARVLNVLNYLISEGCFGY